MTAWLSLPPDRSLRARLSALAEPVIVVLGATLLARIFRRQLGIADADDFLFREGTPPDFLAAAAAESAWHVLRYGSVIILVLLIGRLRGRRARESYGLTLGGQSLSRLVGLGIVLGLPASLPVQLLRLIHEYHPLGADTRFWALSDRVPWNFEFWIYSAVGSFLLVPFVEEFTARGYVLGRLRESYSPGAALLLTSAFFALSHGQYQHAEILGLGSLLSLLILAVLFGYAVFRTGSIVPAIVAHAIANVPLDLTWRWIVLSASLLVLFVFRRGAAEWLKQLAKLLRALDDGIPALLAVVLIATALLSIRATPWAPYAWLAVFAVLFVQGLRIRSSWS